MVSKAKKKSERWNLPSISIETSELIDLLAECAGEDAEIIASNNDDEFSSIEDMRENRDKLHGNPTIEVDGLTISFRDEKSLMSYFYSRESTRSVEDILLVASKIRNHLGKYRNPFRNPNVILTSEIFVAIVAVYLGNFVIDTSSNTFFFSVIGGFMVFHWLVKRYFPPIAVHFNPRETVWQRHKGEILVGGIVAIISVIATLFGTWLVTKYTGTPPT